MQKANLLERLAAVSPGMEVWWDSTPLVFDSWRERMLEEADADSRPILQQHLARMFNAEDPESQLFRGVTTNPIYSVYAIEDDEDRWRTFASKTISESPGIDADQLSWVIYKEIVKLGSEQLFPLFEATDFREGYLSAQIDARDSFDKKAMIDQAIELSQVNQNVMIKIPGTAVGYEAIEELTALGISTNNTTTFVLPQLMECAKAVKRGLSRARANGVDLTRWRSVITHMLNRFGDMGGLREHANSQGIELTYGDVRLAEMAIFKKAYRLLTEGSYESKLLACSIMLGPEVDGKTRAWHLEEMAGGNVIPTCPPKFIDPVLNDPDMDDIEFDREAISRPIAKEVMDKLLRIPYFEKSYAEDGYAPSEFDQLPAVQETVTQFGGFNQKLVEFAEGCLQSSR